MDDDGRTQLGSVRAITVAWPLPLSTIQLHTSTIRCALHPHHVLTLTQPRLFNNTHVSFSAPPRSVHTPMTSTQAAPATAPVSSPASSSPFPSSQPRSVFYSSLLPRVRRVLSSTTDPFASLANVSALIYHSLQTEYGPQAVNWCGFYIDRPIQYQEEAESEHKEDVQSTLVLGPFHGQPAVTLIPHSRGVCGQCVVEQKTQLVPDVHLHPNHIACDERSQSEIVVPVFAPTREGEGGGGGKAVRRLLAVLDIDCPVVQGFGPEDVTGLEAVSALLSKSVDWTHANYPVKLESRAELTEALDTCPSHV